VDVILTQNLKGENTPITRRSVSETVVENLRVLAIDAPDPKTGGGAANGNFGRTVTIDVTPEQAEKINVAAELGKLSLTLRSISGPNGVVATSTVGPGQATGVKPTWAGDVSPALGGAMAEKAVEAVRQPVEVFHGAKRGESVKTE
jgi:pilus assembly protein CpaB